MALVLLRLGTKVVDTRPQLIRPHEYEYPYWYIMLDSSTTYRAYGFI